MKIREELEEEGGIKGRTGRRRYIYMRRTGRRRRKYEMNWKEKMEI